MSATFLVLALARGGATVRVLLTGVVVASACGALVTLVLVLADNGQLRGMMFWLAGDLGWAAHPRIMLAAALLATIVVTIISRPLDVLGHGETTAQSLGLDLTRWRIVIVVLAGLLTAGAVIQGGTIGFIGLVIPHLVRLAFGTAAHRVVAPAAALAGGTLLAAADLVARTGGRAAPAAGRRHHGVVRRADVSRAVAAPRGIRARNECRPPARSADDMRRRLDAIAPCTLGAIQRAVSLGDEPFRERLVIM
jgi:ABC-type Fe3+-siderophore transport system permease subunit